MKYGIAVLPGPSTAKVAQHAEELGFHRVWFYDSQLLCSDVFVIMATAAAATKKIRLATGVLIPSNRIAPVAANVFATLNARGGARQREYFEKFGDHLPAGIREEHEALARRVAA